jgi:hypothetical protein
MRNYIALIHFNMPYATFIPTIVYLDSPLDTPGANIGNPSVFNGYKRLQTATFPNYWLRLTCTDP